MNQNVKQHCLRLLQHPRDKSELQAFLKIVEEESPALGVQLEEFIESGVTEEGYILSKESREPTQVLYVVVRVIPLAVAVRFACECAKKVLPLLERVNPTEHALPELINLVEAWTQGNSTKKTVKGKLRQVQEIAERIDAEWHAAYAGGAFDSLPKRELDLTNQPLFAIDVVLAAAGAVVAPPAAALSNVDEAINKCIEAESVGGNKRARRTTVTWMIERLLLLVNEADT